MVRYGTLLEHLDVYFKTDDGIFTEWDMIIIRDTQGKRLFYGKIINAEFMTLFPILGRRVLSIVYDMRGVDIPYKLYLITLDE